MARRDPHSYADDAQAQTAHLDWAATVDFATQTLAATATLTFRAPAAGPLDLDTRDLTITAVVDQDQRPVPFALAAPDPILGARLTLTLPPATRAVTLTYRTAPTASENLRWAMAC